MLIYPNGKPLETKETPYEATFLAMSVEKSIFQLQNRTMEKTLCAIIIMLSQMLCVTSAEAQLYFSTTDRAQGLPDNYVNTIAEDSQGYIWIGTLGGISRYDGYQHHLYQLINPDGQTVNNVTNITVDDDGQLWATTVVGEVYLYEPDDDTFTFQHKEPSKHKPATEETDSLTDAQGRRWVTTNNSGLRMGDKWFTKDNADPYSLPSNHLNTLLISHGDILWVATAKSGLAFANLNAKGEHTISLPTAEDVSFVHEMPCGQWLVGLDGKGLAMVDAEGRIVSTWDMASGALTNDAVTGCFECRDGSLLIATYGGGIWRFRNGELAEQLAGGDALLSFCRRMGYDAQGQLWIGSMKDGLNCLEPDGTIANFTYSNSPLHTKCVTDVTYDAATRRLYVATSTGLCYVAPSGDICAVSDDPDDDVRLSLLHIRTMTTDCHGRLFVGTDSGICVYDSTFQRIGTSALLSQMEILALASYCSADTFVVATTAKGIYVVRPDLVCYGFGNEYGLGKLALARYALSVTSEGKILAGGFGQFAVIDSRQLSYEESRFALHVSGIEVKGRSVGLTGGELRLRYQESADVFVTTLDYGRASTTLFSYRIDDGEWASADGNCVHFADVGAGGHWLEVAASGAGDVENLRLRIIVSGPWWRSAWALALYLIVAGAAVWLVRRIVRRRPHGNENVEAPEIVVNGADQEFVNRATAIVEAHLAEVEFSVEAFGNEMCLSRSALYKKMMAATGLSPIEFMRTLRMRKGLELVSEGRMSVSEIAAQVGMSPKQFSRFFREQYGMLPSEYISRQQKTNT